ncbi:hypothetical protein Tdes44962_MAKER07225 [Teratosphaeria destructans]|uniref:Uncharacterized protein n=1 Tax=Teratosphaeria destructans TaxID=418781 RepID=A0A9W7W689_9PEZI|nr:hypothetical protein Tdes44962_MAKER07225 [Teratosphaeria destructans]
MTGTNRAIQVAVDRTVNPAPTFESKQDLLKKGSDPPDVPKAKKKGAASKRIQSCSKIALVRTLLSRSYAR